MVLYRHHLQRVFCEVIGAVSCCIFWPPTIYLQSIYYLNDFKVIFYGIECTYTHRLV